MSDVDSIANILNNHTFQVVATGTALLGVFSGVLGVFLTLRKQSLLGDALGHASLPGIVIGFILTGSKNMFALLAGATIFGWLASWLINFISQRNSVVKQDSALALVLSTFFGLGTALLTSIQKTPNAAQAGLHNFIFGQASGMLKQEVNALIIIGMIILALVIVFWKEFKVITFDAHFAQTLPGPYRFFAFLLSLLIVVAIVMGLESVGVVLISALLVNPAIAARQWSNRMSVVVGLSGLFGGISGLLGTFLSSTGKQIPTGATIVIVATCITIISVSFAPERGLIARRRRSLRRQRQLKESLAQEKGESL